MEQKDIDKFRRHLGQEKHIELEAPDGTKDIFTFKPLGVKNLPDFMQLGLALDYSSEQKREIKVIQDKVRKGEVSQDDLTKKYEEFDESNATNIMKEENASLLISLMDRMVVHSYPELDEETRSQFILANFVPLQTTLMELHQDMGKGKVDDKILKKIEQIKAAKYAQANPA